MGVIIDIVSSFIVRAAIITIILNMMITLHDALHKNTQRAVLSENIASSFSVIRHDVKLAGYKAPDKKIDRAFSSEIRFYVDIDNDGTVERVRYYTQTVSGSNPTRYIIKRDVRNSSGITTTMEIARNVVSFSFVFYNDIGSQIGYGSDVPGIKSIAIRVVMEASSSTIGMYSPSADAQLLQTVWKEHIFPKNLQ